MGELKPYPEYKDSNLQWLGKIPKHWEEKRAKYLLREVEERSIKGNELRLAMSQKLGLVPHTEIQEHRLQSESYAGTKLCRINDIVMNRLKAHLGVFALVRQPGIVSPDYTVFRPSPSVNPEYYEYLLKSAPLRPELIQRAKGIIEGFWRLYTDDFYDIRLPVPPVSEQEKIVAFLRQENQKIDEYIRSKRRLIELLNEQKQGIISRAVTRGLDPNVQLKPSGIEWLGNVPEHWTVERIKNFAKPSKQSFIDGDWIETPYITDEGIRLIQTGNIGIGQYREQGFRYITESTFIELKCTEVLPNDILICRLGDPVARACLAPNLGCRMITSVDVCILKPSSNYDSQFLIYAMSNQQYLDWIGSLCRGSTRDRVSRGMLGAFSLPVPPLSEQVKIRDNLNEKLSIMNDIIKVIRNDLSLIYEYRNSLISDIITGKVDIRSEKIVDIHVPSPNEIEMVHFDDGFLGSEEDD